MLLIYDYKTLIFNYPGTFINFEDVFIQGWRTRGAGGPGPLELGIYRVKFLKIHKISFFLLLGPPLGKNRSSTPEYGGTQHKLQK